MNTLQDQFKNSEILANGNCDILAFEEYKDSAPINFAVTSGNGVLKCVYTTKYLGVTIDSNCRWDFEIGDN